MKQFIMVPNAMSACRRAFSAKPGAMIPVGESMIAFCS
jgi:hypothetical protein